MSSPLRAREGRERARRPVVVEGHLGRGSENRSGLEATCDWWTRLVQGPVQ